MFLAERELKMKWELRKVDIKTSFLNTKIDEDVYIILPEVLEKMGVSIHGNI